MKSTIDRSGRIVIPKEIRELVGLKPGVELKVEYWNGNVLIEPVSKIKLVRKGSLLVAKVQGRVPKLTLEETNRILRGVRDRRL